MENLDNQEETSPVLVNTSDTTIEQAAQEEVDASTLLIMESSKENRQKTPRKNSWWIIGGLVGMLLVIFLGALIGYQSGIQRRLKQEKSTVMLRAADQYERGVIDLAEGRYQIAQERFLYVIQLNPTYPGVAEKLREVSVIINTLATPTPLPSPTSSVPTATPTQDYRGAEELYQSVIQLMTDKQWDESIQTMDSLREKYLDYRPIDVDGLYYIALRNRGVQKILSEGNLEPGIYDLSLAERFAPLDADANGYRTWARLYLTGASFWDINWEQVVYYFSQIQPAYPNLRDGSGFTATERYRIGLYKYGDQFWAVGEYCQAKEYYQVSLDLRYDEQVEGALKRAAEECEKASEPPSEPEQPPTEMTPTTTATPEGEPPVEETPMPTETPGG